MAAEKLLSTIKAQAANQAPAAPAQSLGFLGGASSGGNRGASNNLATNPITSGNISSSSAVPNGTNLAGQSVLLPSGQSYTLQGASSGGGGSSRGYTPPPVTVSGASGSNAGVNSSNPIVSNSSSAGDSPVVQQQLFQPVQQQQPQYDINSPLQATQHQQVDTYGNQNQQQGMLDKNGAEIPLANQKAIQQANQQNQQQNNQAYAQQQAQNQNLRAQTGAWDYQPPVDGSAPNSVNTNNPKQVDQFFNNNPDGFSQWKTDKSWAQVNQSKLTSITAQSNIQDSLTNQSAISVLDQLKSLTNMGPGATGAQILQAGLAAQLLAIDDPTINNYLDKMATRATSSYNAGLNLIDAGQGEIDKAIDGTLDNPTTTYGLIAKVNQQNKDFQEESIKNDTTYLQTQKDVNMEQMRTQRADLEGYAKAKLYSIGAEDSSMGISLVAKELHAADLNIQLAEAGYDHGLQQLNIQGRQIMADYTNKVTEQVISLKTDRQNALATYNTALDNIDKDRLANEQQKRTSTTAAFSNYSTAMASYAQQQKQFEQTQLEFAYKKTQDLKDNAIKLSGLTGTVYIPDAKGNLVDTQVPTFDATKWQSTVDYQNAQLNVSKDGQRQQLAESLLTNFGSKAAPQVETLLGLNPGSMNGVKTMSEVTQGISAAELGLKIADANVKIRQMNSDNHAYLPAGSYTDIPEYKLSDFGITAQTDPTTNLPINPVYASVPPSVTGVGRSQTDANGMVAMSNLGGKTAVVASPDGNSISIQTADGTKGGQCGHYVNQVIGQRLMADSYESKMALTDPKIKTPSPGMIFVMPVKGKASPYGHTGFIQSVDVKNGTAVVKDSNWSNNNDEIVRTHTLKLSQITGYIVPDAMKAGYYNNSHTNAVSQNANHTKVATPIDSGVVLNPDTYSTGGMKIALPGGINAPVNAYVGGKVTAVGQGQNGNYVTLQDAYGTSHTYSNLAAPMVKTGQTVTVGQGLGTQGNSGQFSTKKSDTFVQYKVTDSNGQMVDPQGYVTQARAAVTNVNSAIQYDPRSNQATTQNSLATLISSAWNNWFNPTSDSAQQIASVGLGVKTAHADTQQAINSIQFTPAQDKMYRDFYFNGDKTQFEAMTAGDAMAQRKFTMGGQAWLQQQGPQVMKAATNVNPETKTAINDITATFKADKRYQDYQVAKNAYQRFAQSIDGTNSTDNQVVEATYKTLIGLGAQGDINKVDYSRTNLDQFKGSLNTLFGGGYLTANEKAQLKNQALLSYNQAYNDYHTLVNEKNTEASAFASKFDNGNGWQITLEPSIKSTAVESVLTKTAQDAEEMARKQQDEYNKTLMNPNIKDKSFILAPMTLQ